LAAAPTSRTQPIVYVPLRSALESPRVTTILVADAALVTAASALREEVRALNPSLALHAIQSLDEVVAGGREAQKLLGTWLGMLAGIALLLASVGLFALTAHNVVQRTHEIGVRMARGASLGRVIWLFLRRSLVHLALGVTLGMAGALSAGKLFGAFVLHGGATDYPTTSFVTFVLVIITTLACMFPARRAARVDPLVALRHE
jgi:putative ABC transport system permease protein